MLRYILVAPLAPQVLDTTEINPATAPATGVAAAMMTGATELEVGATQVDEGAGSTQEDEGAGSTQEEDGVEATSATGVAAGAAEERTLQRFCLLACLGSRRAN